MSNSLVAARHNPPTNPFATRFVRPGVLPFRFNEGSSINDLMNQLILHRWQGQIIGPHGSGKSTLLSALTTELGRQGRTVRTIRGLPAPGSMGEFWRDSRQWDERTQIVVDGFECLPWWQRWLLVLLCKQRRCGLLVTAHHDLGIPWLYQTSTSLPTAYAIVRQLLPDGSHCFTDAEIAGCFRTVKGNIRELLFTLYDLYEERNC